MHVKTTVQKVPGSDELYINLPENMFTAMGWDANTKLTWVIADNGVISIRPLDESE